MPNNLLIVPLLAGYIFLHWSLRFRYRAQWLDGYRLLIESAVAGACLLLVARLLVVGLDLLVHLAFPGLARIVRNPLPEIPYFGTATVSFLLAIVVPPFLNRLPQGAWKLRMARSLRRHWSSPGTMARRVALVLRRNQQRNRATAIDLEVAHGNALIRLLHEASASSALVAITLSNRKWYVGYVAEAMNLEPQETFFSLLPLISGHRDKDTLITQGLFTYRDVYEATDKYLLVIRLRLEDVQDARYFDERVYETYFRGPRMIQPA
jgi:hypothetical protein